MSSSAPPVVPKIPFLAASGFFCVLAGFIAHSAIRPLGAADLLGLGACVAAASVFAAIPFVIDFALRLDAGRQPVASPPTVDPAPDSTPPSPPSPSPELLADLVASAVDARLAAALPAWSERLAAALSASEEKHREDILRTLAAHQSPPLPRPLDTDAITAPVGAKPRLGRGLLGLMHGPGAITPPASPVLPPTES